MWYVCMFVCVIILGNTRDILGRFGLYIFLAKLQKTGFQVFPCVLDDWSLDRLSDWTPSFGKSFVR